MSVVKFSVREDLERQLEYWRIRNAARDHLASIRDLSAPSIKQELKNHLKTSGDALKLQNLAYSLKHRLLLPFEDQDIEGDNNLARYGPGPQRTSNAGALYRDPEGAQKTEQDCLEKDKEIESRVSDPNTRTSSPLHTSFSVQARLAQAHTHPGELAHPRSGDSATPGLTSEGVNLSKSELEPHEHGNTASLASSEAPDPPQLHVLRDHWQAIVVDRLMRVAARSGEPLARRARDEATLTRLRTVQSSSFGIYEGEESPGLGECEAGSMCAAHRIGREIAIEQPALDKPPVNVHVISIPLLQRGVTAVLRGEPVVPNCENPGDAATLELPPPEVPQEPDAICPELLARVPTWEQLRERFADLHPRLRQVGADEANVPWFAARSQAVARAAVELGKIPEARSVLRRGAPRTWRRQLWCLSLCLPETVARSRFNTLCETVESRQLLTDSLISHAASSLSDSEDFFLFTEIVRSAALAFSRDPSVAVHSAVPAHPRLVGLGKGGQRHGLYPPCGCLPSEWICSLAAPLAYIFGTSEGVFLCLRALYCSSEF